VIAGCALNAAIDEHLNLDGISASAMQASPPAYAFRVLYRFAGGSDGANPRAGLARDPAGNLYGTTYGGGASNAGVVFKIDPLGNEATLYSFKGGFDGAHPQAGVVFDGAGNVYGTTTAGGNGQGVVFKLDSSGNETVLYRFSGGVDGSDPQGTLTRDSSSGKLYGTTYWGGQSGKGVVFALDPSTGLQTVLHNFSGYDGAHPNSPLFRDSAGNLYDTTAWGGNNNNCMIHFGCGVVFKLDTTGKEHVLHSFSGGADGGSPGFDDVILDTAGNLYGATSAGGNGDGVVFMLNPTNHETVLHTFNVSDGNAPYAGLVRDNQGNLYGTTLSGGSSGAGVVFRIDAQLNETLLYNFTGGRDGGEPVGDLVRDSLGNLYGVTVIGGGHDALYGVVFELSPSAVTNNVAAL
jgi:uncharacterized repeat protein (TIGR03803 family)